MGLSHTILEDLGLANARPASAGAIRSSTNSACCRIPVAVAQQRCLRARRRRAEAQTTYDVTYAAGVVECWELLAAFASSDAVTAAPVFDELRDTVAANFVAAGGASIFAILTIKCRNL